VGCTLGICPAPSSGGVDAKGGRVGGASRWAGTGGIDVGDDDGGAGLAVADANGECCRPC
jgi:hypothetical protein